MVTGSTMCVDVLGTQWMDKYKSDIYIIGPCVHVELLTFSEVEKDIKMNEKNKIQQDSL